MDRAILQATATALSELDFSAENARIAELEQEITQIEAARASAQSRVDEIGKELKTFNDPDTKAVARALLNNVPPSEAVSHAPAKEELQKERDSLRPAITELYHQAQRLRGEITSIQRETKARARMEITPLVDLLKTQITSGAEALIQCFASFKAIDYAIDGLSGEADLLSDAIGALSGERCGGTRRFIPSVRQYNVPPEIVTVLRPLESKGPAFKGKVYDTATRN